MSTSGGTLHSKVLQGSYSAKYLTALAGAGASGARTSKRENTFCCAPFSTNRPSHTVQEVEKGTSVHMKFSNTNKDLRRVHVPYRRHTENGRQISRIFGMISQDLILPVGADVRMNSAVHS